MIESYEETRVVLAPSGELALALPIYADQGKAIFKPKDVESIVDLKNVGIGIYEHFGYLIYHPTQQYSFYLKSLDLFEDLGEL